MGVSKSSPPPVWFQPQTDAPPNGRALRACLGVTQLGCPACSSPALPSSLLMQAWTSGCDAMLNLLGGGLLGGEGLQGNLMVEGAAALGALC